MLKWANKNPGIILALVLVVIFLAANGLHVITYPPRSIHQWRQSDCWAYARTYFAKGTGLFTPSTYNLAGNDGRVASEFPILYYIAGNLFHVFGMHYFILRGLTFICYLLGLFYLYKCICLWVRPTLLIVFPIVLIATSPFYFYYGLNYLPNVPAISFSFAGLYYWLLYEQSGKTKHVVYGTLFLILSTLLKPTDGGLLWVAFMAVMAIKLLQRQLTRQRFLAMVLGSVAIALTIYGWYKYVDWYNNVNGNHQNLLSIYPIWMMNQKDIDYVLDARIGTFWRVAYHQKAILYFLALAAIIYIVRWNVMNKFLRLFCLFLIPGAFIYDILWFTAFSDHDYYQLVNVMPCVFVVICVIEWYVRRIMPRLPQLANYAIGLLLFGLAVVGIRQNRNIMHDRYYFSDFVYRNPDIYEVEPYLRQIGIKPTDIIVSAPDPSPNITLAAYGNPGYTESFTDDNYNIGLFREHGAKYLIINDTAYLHNPRYVPFMAHKIGQFKDNISIYDIGH